jgi:hypothetical protein
MGTFIETLYLFVDRKLKQFFLSDAWQNSQHWITLRAICGSKFFSLCFWLFAMQKICFLVYFRNTSETNACIEMEKSSTSYKKPQILELKTFTSRVEALTDKQGLICTKR